MSNELAMNGSGYLARQGDGEFEHVTKDEVTKLITETNSEKTRLLIKVLWATGARISEVLSLKTDDLDAKKSTLRITRLKRRKPFKQEVPIGPDLASELRLYIKTTKRRGSIFSANRFSAFRTIRNLGRKVLHRDISPHHFRHGKVYDMIQRGTHPLVVSRALGHASINSALNYFHPTEIDLRTALEA